MNLASYQQKLDSIIAHLQKEFTGLQVGKASPALVENISIELSYGDMKISQMAHVTVMDAQTLKIEPWDKTVVKSIEKAIYDAAIGLAPQNEGTHVLIKIPPLTQERRQEIVKQVKALGEDTKAHVRRVRQDAMHDTKKQLDAKDISEDEHKVNEKSIEDIIKKVNTTIDDLVSSKSESVMKI
jgi:ribosome recycling factor